MKKLLLSFIVFPYLLISQSNQTVDTLEISQVEIKNELVYKIGAEEPFTGFVIISYGIGLRGKFVGEVQTYTNGKLVIYTRWDSFEDHQLEETYALQGADWVQISWTNYYSDGQKLSHHDYENDKTSYWYEDGSIKEEIGEDNYIPYHKFWDQNGNEIIPVKSKPKNSAPLYKTMQDRINNLGAIVYFLLFIATIGLMIFKLQKAENPSVLKIVFVTLFSLLALIITLSLNNDIKGMSYERYGLWGTLFGSLYSIIYVIPFSFQTIAILIVLVGIRKK